MADFDYYGADYGLEDEPRFAGALRGFGIANWMGALTSVGLTAGLAVWAVDLTFRDVSTVPVILAMEGPMRVQPEDPGGEVARFQGMALSDITSGNGAAPAPEQIVLAPPPVALDAPALAERVAAAALADEAEAVEVAALDAPEEVPAEADAVDLAMLDAAASPAETVSAVAEVAPAAEDPTAGTDFRLAIAAAIAEAQPDAAPSGIASSIERSLRPQRRPASPLQIAGSTPIDAPAQARGIDVASAGMPDLSLTDAVMASAREVDAASLDAGTRIVQLGAFDSAAVARAEWARLEGRFAAYMDGKRRLVEQARAGGRDFWRLRAVGFADGDEARRFCAELVAHDAACIPVTVR